MAVLIAVAAGAVAVARLVGVVAGVLVLPVLVHDLDGDAGARPLVDNNWSAAGLARGGVDDVVWDGDVRVGGGRSRIRHVELLWGCPRGGRAVDNDNALGSGVAVLAAAAQVHDLLSIDIEPGGALLVAAAALVGEVGLVAGPVVVRGRRPRSQARSGRRDGVENLRGLVAVLHVASRVLIDDGVSAGLAVARSLAEAGAGVLAPPSVRVDVGVDIGGAHCGVWKRISARRARGRRALEDERSRVDSVRVHGGGNSLRSGKVEFRLFRGVTGCHLSSEVDRRQCSARERVVCV